MLQRESRFAIDSAASSAWDIGNFDLEKKQFSGGGIVKTTVPVARVGSRKLTSSLVSGLASL